jgi:hypothetical protein
VQIEIRQLVFDAGASVSPLVVQDKEVNPVYRGDMPVITHPHF